MKLFIFLAIFIFSLTLQANVGNSPSFLVHLLSYLAQDYGGAVANGKIIAKGEYEEQIEFIESAIKTSAVLKETKDHDEIQRQLKELQKLIFKKADPKVVAALALKIKGQVITVAGLQVAPTLWPDQEKGGNLYAQNCVTCHGVKGAGDGPAGAALDPKPANFFDQDRMKVVSPYQAFNTIKLGLNGTAMASFAQLSDDEIWALAFYVVSLRYRVTAADHVDIQDQLAQDLPPLEKVASLSDEELSQLLKGDQKSEALVALRLKTKDDDTGGSLKLAQEFLDQSVRHYHAKEFDIAKNLALRAYLEGVEPVEPRLKASDPRLMYAIEDKMSDVRKAISKNESEAKVQQAVDVAKAAITEATGLLKENKPSPALTFLMAAAILLREGFEAVLVIIALLGVIRATGSRKAALWLHGGWIAAVFLGFVAWFFSGWVMKISGAQREMMEGSISLFAVVILLYMGFWLHSKTEIGRWKTFIDGRIKTALEGSSLIGIASISFMAVFREAFETVLFLRALWIEAGGHERTAITLGVFVSLAVIFILSWAIVKYTARIPIRQLFNFSSSLMALLAFVLIGKGIHSIQETGLISASSFPLNLRFDLFGLYPTLETWIGQILVLALTALLWHLGKRPSPKDQEIYSN